MADDGVKIEGLAELNANLATFRFNAMKALRDVVFYGCNLIANDAKQDHGLDAHAKARYKNITTNLTQSIQVPPIQNDVQKIRGEVVAGMEYAADVELGTAKARPYPYLLPALEKNSEEIIKETKYMLQALKWVNK